MFIRCLRASAAAGGIREPQKCTFAAAAISLEQLRVPDVCDFPGVTCWFEQWNHKQKGQPQARRSTAPVRVRDPNGPID